MLNQLMEAYGIAPSEVMAFGDAMNDYEILRMVGTSVAMGNARSAIKEIATKTIGANVEHAVQSEMRAVLDARDGESSPLRRKNTEAASQRSETGDALRMVERSSAIMGGNVIRALRTADSLPAFM